MAKIPKKLSQQLGGTSKWNGKELLEFQPIWKSLNGTKANLIPDVAGIYALGLKVPLGYQRGQSFVFYIGSSTNLRKRIASHRLKPQNEVIEMLADEFGSGFQFTFWKFEGLSRKWLRTIEGETLWAFEEAFLSAPIANLDIPETVFGAGRHGIVDVKFQSDSRQSTSLDELATKFNRVLRFEELHPIGSPGQITMTLAFSEDGELLTPGKYRAARFIEPEIIERERKNEIEHLAWITDEYAAAWTIEKFKRLIQLSSQLVPVKTKAKTVRKFESASREVPLPDTWGEVALIKARIEAGCWLPQTDRVWLKIVFGKELLGEAKLFDYMFQGIDRSDLPQRSKMRTSYWEGYEPVDYPTYRDGEMIEIERKEGYDENTGETYLHVRSELTLKASDRLEREREEFSREEQRKLQNTIEKNFLSAWNQLNAK